MRKEEVSARASSEEMVMEERRERYLHNERGSLVYVVPRTDCDADEHDDVGSTPQVDILRTQRREIHAGGNAVQYDTKSQLAG